MNGLGARSVHENLPADPQEAAVVSGLGKAAGWVPLGLFALIAVGAGLWSRAGEKGLASPSGCGLLALAGLGWCGAVVWARGSTDSARLLVGLLGGALLLRLLCWTGDAQLSDDIERYLWEGALTLEGVDPYRHAPSDALLAPFQARWPELHRAINHPTVPAAYPPLAQVLNGGLVALAGGPEHAERARLLIRALQGLADLAVALPLIVLLRRRRLPIALSVAWLWSPWLVQEFAGSGHLDALAIACTVLAVALADREPLRQAHSLLPLGLLAVGTALKLLPILLLPNVLRQVRRPLLGALFFTASFALCCAPFVALTGALPSAQGLGEYAFRWESFNLGFRFLEDWLARHYPYDESWSDPRWLARGGIALLWLGFFAAAWWRSLDLARASLLLFGGFLALTPTLHPWYLAWVTPWLAFGRWAAWRLVLACIPLLYWPLAGFRASGVWHEPAWLFPLVGGTFWLLTLGSFLRPRA
jgi:hypothetical protein